MQLRKICKNSKTFQKWNPSHVSQWKNFVHTAIFDFDPGKFYSFKNGGRLISFESFALSRIVMFADDTTIVESRKNTDRKLN